MCLAVRVGGWPATASGIHRICSRAPPVGGSESWLVGGKRRRVVSTGAASRLPAPAIATHTFGPALVVAGTRGSRGSDGSGGSGGSGGSRAATRRHEDTSVALGSRRRGGRRHHRVRRCVGWREGHDWWLRTDHHGSCVGGWGHGIHHHSSNDSAANDSAANDSAADDSAANDHGLGVGGSAPVQERRGRAEPAAVHRSCIIEGVDPHLHVQLLKPSDRRVGR